MAAKWPPRPDSVQCTLLSGGSAKRLIGGASGVRLARGGCPARVSGASTLQWPAAHCKGDRHARGGKRPGTLLVGLDVTGTTAAREAGGTARRWQVLTVSGDRITDIRGFDDRTQAAARAGVPA
jgi:hypothetical protein